MEEPIEKEELPEDEETRRLMKEHDMDQDTAEKVKEIMDEEGLDEDEAIELAEEL